MSQKRMSNPKRNNLNDNSFNAVILLNQNMSRDNEKYFEKRVALAASLEIIEQDRIERHELLLAKQLKLERIRIEQEERKRDMKQQNLYANKERKIEFWLQKKKKQNELLMQKLKQNLYWRLLKKRLF
jgi:hypothetical protein